MTEESKRQNKVYNRIDQKIRDTAVTFDCLAGVVDADERDPGFNGSMVRVDLNQVEDDQELTNLLRIVSHQISEVKDELRDDLETEVRIETLRHEGEYFLCVREVEE